MGIIYNSNVRILLLEYEELNDSKKNVTHEQVQFVCIYLQR